jgi:fibronectin-binding autotransporter adhesin
MSMRKSSTSTKSGKSMILAAAAAATIGGSFIASRASAANATWTGATDTFWNQANWDNAGPYTIVAGDALFFGAAGPTTSHNDFTAGTSFAGITFNSGAQAFTLEGNDIALTGPIVVNAGNGNVETINLNITGGAATGISMSSATSTTGNSLTLNGNVSVGTLAATGQNTTALPSNTLAIGANKTLTLAGGITVGGLGAASLDLAKSQLAVTGTNGSLIANATGAQLLITNQSNTNTAVQALLDLSGLGTFSFTGGSTGSVNIGNGNRGFGGLRLASVTNTITVGTVLLGAGGSGNGGTGTILLGSGSNVINATTINVTQNKGAGGIFFDPTNTTGTLKIRGTGGTDADRSTITIGNFSTNGSNSGGASMVFGTNGVDIKAGTLTIINSTTGSGSLSTGMTGTFSFGGASSTVDVNNVAMINKTGVTVFNGVVTSNLLMGGGNLTVNTGFSMMNLPAASTALTQTNAVASFSISGGNATVNSDITQTNGLAANVKIDLNGGRLNMTGHSIGSSTGQITLLSSAGTLANVGQINGGTGAGVTKTGSSTTLRLEGANPYSAPTAVNAGTLLLLSGATLPNTTTITLGSGAALDLAAVAGYTVGSGRALGGAGTVYGPVSVASGGTIVAGGGGTPSSLTFNDSLDLAGGTTLKLTPNVGSSAGAIVVNGAVNTSGGASSVTISIPGGLSLGTYTLLDYGSLTGTGFSAFSFTPSGRTIANLVDNTANTSVDLNVTSVDFPVWTGSLSSEWSTATLAAPKNWVLNSNNATTTDYIESDSVLFNDSASGTTTIDVSVADVNPGTVTFNNSSKNYTVTGSKAIAGATGLFKNGSGSVAIATNNTYTGGTVINGGTVQLGTGGTTGSLGTGSITVNGGNLTLNKTGAYALANTISGNGSVSINNAATVTLATTGNTYTGGTTVNSGASFRVAGAMAGTGSITVASGGTLAITGNITNPINSLGGGTIGMGTVSLGGDATFATGTTTNLALFDPNTPAAAQGNGTFTGVLHGGGTINILANPGLVALGTFNVDGGGAFRPVNNTANSDFNGTIVLNPGVKGEIGISTAGFSTAGSAKIIMTSGTFNSGATTGDFSLLNVRNNQGLANAPFGNNVEVVAGSGSFVTLNPLDVGALGPFTVAMGNLKVPGNITVGVNKNGATANLVSFQSVNLTGGATGPTIFSPSTLNYNSGTTAMLALNNISESVAGSSIVMDGQTTLIITGNNTYTGTTGLKRGTTRMNGTYSGGGAWSVSSGATLTGTGTINAPVSVASGGIVAPGTGIGSISVGALSLDAGSLNFEVGAAGVDRINGSGGLTLTGVSTFALQDLTGLAAGTYPLIDYTGTLTGDLTNLALSTASINGFALSLVNNTSNTSIDLRVGTPSGNSSWNVDADGNWSVASNWASNTQPDGVDQTATFGSVITAPRAVTVDAPKTVGAVTFDNANSYTIAGPGTLTLNVSSGQASVNVTNGSHTISAPVVLSAPTNFTVSQAASTLAITGNLTATGKSISKNGAGTLKLENLRSAGVILNEGTILISAKPTPNSPAGTSVVDGFDIAFTGQIDLTNNSLVEDYASGTHADSIRQLIEGGRITSSSADATHRLGYGDNSVLHKATFAGQSVDETSTLVKFTYGGDSNLDGQVDVTDLGALATSWQTSNVWTGGDFNYDGFVDVSDLGILATNWQLGVGSPLGPGSLDAALAAVGLGGVSVPEPTSGALLMLGLSAVATRRRRRLCCR